MSLLGRWNPKKDYDIREIFNLCKLTSLTYPEIAAFEGVPTRIVLRICAKKTRRTSGRPRALTKEDITYKINQILNFYKKQRKSVDPLKLERLVKYLTGKIQPEKKVIIHPKIKKQTVKRADIESHELALVIDFLVEKHKKEEQDIPFTMATFAKLKQINYDNFTRVVKRRIKDAWAVANQYILRLEKSQLEEKYREYVIDYIAKQELLSQSGKILNKLDYVEQNGLDYSIFLKYFRKYRAVVKDEALKRFRELEEERLQKLRTQIPEIESRPISAEEIPTISIIEKAARKKLPIRDGRIIFSSTKKENERLENLWLQIADDVSKVGLRDAVAEKWANEMGLPDLPLNERNRLILLRIETVLKQLDLFFPPKTLSFQQLSEWVHPPKIVLPEIEEPVILEKPVLVTGPKLEEYDEKWLEHEIAKEETEVRRYLDTPEERMLRRRDGFVIPSEVAGSLSKSQLMELKNIGAIYENGDWLLLTKDDLEKFMSKTQKIQASVWPHLRKPRLLIAIGPTDYTKEWMHKAFDIIVTNDYGKIRNFIISFKPDALMVYKSSSSKKLYETMTELGREIGLPLLIFDRGFADLIISAEKQKVAWFIDAFQRRKTFLRRYNPIMKKTDFFRRYLPRMKKLIR